MLCVPVMVPVCGLTTVLCPVQLSELIIRLSGYKQDARITRRSRRQSQPQVLVLQLARHLEALRTVGRRWRP